jgi:hypothetical protein
MNDTFVTTPTSDRSNSINTISQKPGALVYKFTAKYVSTQPRNVKKPNYLK